MVESSAAESASASASAALSSEERADVAALAQELPPLRHQLQELDILLQQNRVELASQRLRSESAEQALRELEQDGNFSREQYKQAVLQAHQSQLRHLSVEHQQELLASKQETVQQIVDVAEFALLLAHRLDPSAVDPANAVRPVLPSEPSAPPDAATDPGAASPPPGETALIDAQEGERAWIARQLHNGPAQALTNLILRAEICERMIGSDTQAVQRELHELRQTIHRTLQEMRRFIFDVRPMILDDLGLLPALRRFVDDWNTQGTQPAVMLTVSGQERRIARAKELAIFRIVQDAIKMPEGRDGGQAIALHIDLEDGAIRVTLEVPSASQLESGAATLPSAYHIIQQRCTIIGGTTSLTGRGGTRVLQVTVPDLTPTLPGPHR
jgi:two-component system, NarL family, sensor histidine kinase DegS